MARCFLSVAQIKQAALLYEFMSGKAPLADERMRQEARQATITCEKPSTQRTLLLLVLRGSVWSNLFIFSFHFHLLLLECEPKIHQFVITTAIEWRMTFSDEHFTNVSIQLDR